MIHPLGPKNLWILPLGLRFSPGQLCKLEGHSAKNNTGHFQRSQIEKLANKGPKSISCHIESSIMIIYIISQHLGSSRFYLGQF